MSALIQQCIDGAEHIVLTGIALHGAFMLLDTTLGAILWKQHDKQQGE